MHLVTAGERPYLLSEHDFDLDTRLGFLFLIGHFDLQHHDIADYPLRSVHLVDLPAGEPVGRHCDFVGD